MVRLDSASFLLHIVFLLLVRSLVCIQRIGCWLFKLVRNFKEECCVVGCRVFKREVLKSGEF